MRFLNDELGPFLLALLATSAGYKEGAGGMRTILSFTLFSLLIIALDGFRSRLPHRHLLYRNARKTSNNKKQATCPPPLRMPVVKSTMSDYPSKNEYLEEKQDSTKILPSHLKDLQDLVDRGVLRIWRRSTNQMAPGARGSGHNSKTSSGHVEPEEIYIIGTAHVSDQSAKDVARVIRTVDPDNVVVELCRSRSATLYIDDEGTTEGGDQSANGMRINSLSMSGNNFQAALQRSLKLGGFPALVLRSLMAQTSPESVEIMSKSGVDFRAARRAAEDVGAQIVLGDRPIEITLERAWEAMTWAERKKLIVLILESVQQIKAAGKNEIMDTISTALSDEGKDILQQYEMKLQEYIPNLLLPLITERDIFLSLTMKSSMAVNGCKCVVGVVGRAHLEGVVKALGEDHSGKFKTLTYTRRRAAMKEKYLVSQNHCFRD